MEGKKFLEEVYADSEFDYIDENRNEFKTIKNYFTHSIEHEWTDLFWAYAVNDYIQRKSEYDVLPEEEKLKLETSNLKLQNIKIES